MASDAPVGQVRREEHEGGQSIWVRMDERATKGKEWTCIASTSRGNVGFTLGHDAVKNLEVIGGVPGTPGDLPSLSYSVRMASLVTDMTGSMRDAMSKYSELINQLDVDCKHLAEAAAPNQTAAEPEPHSQTGDWAPGDLVEYDAYGCRFTARLTKPNGGNCWLAVVESFDGVHDPEGVFEIGETVSVVYGHSVKIESAPMADSELRDRIDKAITFEIGKALGYSSVADVESMPEGLAERVLNAADAIMAVVAPVLAERDGQIAELKARHIERDEINAGWVKYKQQKIQERRDHQKALADALGIGTDEFGRYLPVPALVHEVAEMRHERDVLVETAEPPGECRPECDCGDHQGVGSCGCHVTGEEAREWIRRLETADDLRRHELLTALGMNPLRDWDDIRNAAAGIRKDRDFAVATRQQYAEERDAAITKKKTGARIIDGLRGERITLWEERDKAATALAAIKDWKWERPPTLLERIELVASELDIARRQRDALKKAASQTWMWRTAPISGVQHLVPDGDGRRESFCGEKASTTWQVPSESEPFCSECTFGNNDHAGIGSQPDNEPGEPHNEDVTAMEGVSTPGCDCGHSGMAAGWHSSDCAWKTASATPTEPRVWRNPDDPHNRAPDDVHRVHDADGHVWEMKLGGDWVCRSGRTPNVYAWFALMAQYGPLTEVVVDQPGGDQ